MSVCTFFGHSECYGLEKGKLYQANKGHPKNAIVRRNRWMIRQAEYCLCYIDRTWGGAYKFVQLAKKQGLFVRNLGRAIIEL